MPDQATAVADLARDLGTALTAFADAVRPPIEQLAPADDGLAGLGLGKRQQEIAELPGLNDDKGMRANEIAYEIAYDNANTHTALKALKDRGVVEEIRAGAGEPPRWRLSPSYRGTSDPYVRMAGFTRPGEWTTYGDISIAVRGDVSAARAVGRAAAKLPYFPAPHRVLKSGGIVPPTWKSDDSSSPDPGECVRRLKAEGVAFYDNGQAERTSYISWDVLVERNEQEG